MNINKNDLSQYDKIQREQALDITQSFIVQAPAGSGKTEILIQRFLALLNQVKKPEEILAITFTKKAANEMRLRIIKALKQALSDETPVSLHAKKTWQLAKKVLEKDKKLNWQLINNPNRLSIQTIDSFCVYLTKQLPLLSHFGSQPDIAIYSLPLYQAAAEEVLTHLEENVEWSEAIAHLLLHLDNDLNKLHQLLMNLLAKRDQWLPYLQFNAHDESIKKQLEYHLKLVITDTLCIAHNNFSPDIILQLLPIFNFAQYHLASLPGSMIADFSDWRNIAKFLLTKKLTFRKRVDEEMGFPPLQNFKNSQEKSLHQEYRKKFSALIASLENNEAVRQALADILALPNPHYQEKQWQILKSLLQILKITVAQLKLIFKQHGQIDFIENTEAAILALGQDESPTDLALFLDYQIKHILIDEFQDTSFIQYQLLKKLIAGWENGDGRTLFIVGDPMQSIYRFRQAEVGLFMRMGSQGIGDLNLIPLTLSLNFRSMPPLVEWNNIHFTQIFPRVNNIANGAVTFSPSLSALIDNNKTNIEINCFLNDNGEEEASYITELIKNIKQQNSTEKIAILVRSRSHLKYIISSLKNNNVNYQAIEIDLLAKKPCIQDLLALTCAMLHPADRISWLSILRAPWCGLTLSDLLLIANERHQIIWEQINQSAIIKKLSRDGQTRLNKLTSILKLKMHERQRVNLRIFIENTWLLLGGPACLTNQADLENVQSFFALLEQIEQQRIVDINQLREKINQLYASYQHNEHVVQIMTIHTAKGLEFDTVILPQLNRKMPSDDKSLLTWIERPLANEKMALLLAPLHETGDEKDILYEYIREQHKIKSDHEIDRLFYVAATRAKQRLYLTFNINQNTEENLRIEPGSFLTKIWPCLSAQKKSDLLNQYNNKININSNNLNNLNNNISINKKIKYLTRLTSSWMNPFQDQENNFALHQKSPGLDIRDHTPILIGTVTHHLLQLLTKNQQYEWWSNLANIEQKNYLSLLLKQHNIANNKLDNAIQFIQQAIATTLTDSRGQWILKPHKEAQSEFNLTANIDGKIQHCIIDRTFIDENNTRWIIDYKTTITIDSNKNLVEFMQQEQNKYLEKMQQYASAMQLLENNSRPIKLGLYFPAIPAWKEWEV